MKPGDADDVWEFFHERAAIMRYDGGVSLADAEFRALVRTRLYFKERGVELPYAGYFSFFSDAELGWSDAAGTVIVFPCKQTLSAMAHAAIEEADLAGRRYTYWLGWRKPMWFQT